MKREVVTWFNFKVKKDHLETPVGESQTIVGESWTIPELLARSAQGLNIGSGRSETYDPDDVDFDDTDMSKLSRSDLVEKAEKLQQTLDKEIETARGKLKEKKQAEKKESEKKEVEKKDDSGKSDKPE